MTEPSPLAPLWSLGTGAVVAAVATSLSHSHPGPLLAWAAMALGLLAASAAARHPNGRRHLLMWGVAGLALVGGRGLVARDARQAIEDLLSQDTAPALRVAATIADGWEPSRWGLRTTVTIHTATHADRELPLPHRCPLEIRGAVDASKAPQPGARVGGLLGLRGEALRPLLVASSATLLESTSAPSGIAWLRDRIATSLLESAGTRPSRIRAAQLAAALAVGRRDMIPRERREMWRRSGFAHLLAVSGLHVGLVGGGVWLLGVAMGWRPSWVRLAVLVVLPTYAVLSGASPSAVRAAAMGMIYLFARLIGRPLEPMAAVLLAATAMLLHQPALVLSVSFQLTVLVTAALVRWAMPAAQALPGPRWFTAAVAVPVVAQLAAAPVVAIHFRSAIPGSVLANLLVLPLLAPLLLVSLACAAVAPLWHAAGAALLDLLHLVHQVLWWCGAAGRGMQVIAPPAPMLSVIGLAAAGWLALQPGSRARSGVVAWTAVAVVTAVWWCVRPASCAPGATLLPVAEGTAVVVHADSGATILIDGGRRHREAAELLAEMGLHHLDAVVASHADEDHIAGLISVLESCTVGRLVVPQWMRSDGNAQPLLRSARTRGIATTAAVRGSLLGLGGVQLRVLWPPAIAPAKRANDRSLVLHIALHHGRILFTGDSGTAVERELAAKSWLRSDVLVVGHHGSRGSTSVQLLAACRPRVALIPAGPANTHHHPSPEVVHRLLARRVPQRSPLRDGWCGAQVVDGRWRPFP